MDGEDNEGRLENLAACKNRIKTATNKLLKLQNLIRTMLKEGDNLNPQKIDVSSSLKEILDLFQPLLYKNNITLTSNVKSDIFVESIPGKIETIVTNIVHNSIKYMKESEKREISVNLLDYNDKIKIVLSDTGPGIPKDRMKKIWDQFGASGSQANDGIIGSGFGLYQIKKMIEDMQGEIDLSSDSSGTIFTICIFKTISKKNESQLA